MSVLQAQPSLSISTNQCKQKFLMNQIESMKVTKDIYCGIFDQLKGIVKKVSLIGENRCGEKGKVMNQQCDKTNVSHNASLSIVQHDVVQSNKQRSLSPSDLNVNQQSQKSQQHPIQSINSHIKQFTQQLQKKVTQYCSSSISKNIVKYLQIQKQQHQFYPILTHQLNTFIKTNQTLITHREKQLQQIEYQKYQNHNNLSHNNSNSKDQKKNRSSIDKDRKSTQKTISSFDFNKRVMDVVKKEIAMLKLKKRQLQLQIEQKKNNINKKDKQHKSISQNHIHQINKINNISSISPQTTVKSEELYSKKLSHLNIKNTTLSQQSTTRKTLSSKNDTSSAFQKIVMIYQKQKFLNTRIQEQISKLKIKISSQRQQNVELEEKTHKLQKQIQKLDWTKVCDSSFAQIHHKKIDKPIQLSILDRTFSKVYDQKSLECSQMSINQSMIRKD